MRIAQIAPLAESVPPKLYGGTERVMAWLIDELVELGHDVTLFASGNSKTRAKLEAIWLFPHDHTQGPACCGRRERSGSVLDRLPSVPSALLRRLDRVEKADGMAARQYCNNLLHTNWHCLV